MSTTISSAIFHGEKVTGEMPQLKSLAKKSASESTPTRCENYRVMLETAKIRYFMYKKDNKPVLFLENKALPSIIKISLTRR